ncbi:unnamed protein product [Urochloa humidicola]
MAAAPPPSVPACGDLPAAVSAFADAFVDFAVSGIFFPTSSPASSASPSIPPPSPTTPTTFLPSPSRLIAIGDLHGDLPKSLSALRLAGLVPPASTAPDSTSASATSWAAGPTLAVQLGDILDRGGDELRLLYLLRRLALSSEVMNVSGDFRFATP